MNISKLEYPQSKILQPVEMLSIECRDLRFITDAYSGDHSIESSNRISLSIERILNL